MHSTILLIILILKAVIIQNLNNSIVFIYDHSENRHISKKVTQNVKYVTFCRA